MGVEGISGVENSRKAFLFLVTADLPAKKKVLLIEFLEFLSISVRFNQIYSKIFKIIQNRSISIKNH
jgi:hypothetical protein